MANAIEYALMAGASYISNRADLNKFPIPQGWAKVVDPDSYFRDPISGFEAISFTNGSDIVISFAGTDFSLEGVSDFTNANIPLVLGIVSEQLKQAAEYYLEVKALNPGAHISLTGHSLGGGLAALVGVFFGETAFTFDQAPFAQTAKLSATVLKSYLLTDGYTEAELSNLTNFISLQESNGGIPNEGLVINLNVQGEIVSLGSALRIGNSASIPQGTPFDPLDVSFAIDLHSEALLSAFLQSNQTAAANPSLSDVTFKLPDLLKMIFSDQLFARPVDKSNTTEENFLERLVRHEAGVGETATSSAILADAMVTRFTSDMWKIAQDGGFTLTNKDITNTLVAFAMQKYYEEPASGEDHGKALFTSVYGGIRFDRTDVSASLFGAKGWQLYFQNYLNTLTLEEHQTVERLLPAATDWFIQAGILDMIATADEKKAFMVGGIGNDWMVGGSEADLLIGNAGDDHLGGGTNNDTLLGGAGFDTYVINPGDGYDTVLDSDGSGVIKFGTVEAKGKTSVTNAAKWIQRGNVWQDQEHGLTYGLATLADGSQALFITDLNGSTIEIRGWSDGELGIELGAGSALVAAPPSATSLTIVGDLGVGPYGNASTSLDELGNLIGTIATPNREDTLYDSADNDHVQGLGGNDILYAWRGGDDLLEGGTGQDWLSGGAGNDTLVGGADSDVLQSGANNDQLFGSDQISDLAAAILASETQPGTGGRGDWLSADDGTDSLVGDAGNDVLLGGEGEDLLIGGGGNDNLYGDQSGNASIDWTLTRSVTVSGDVTTYATDITSGGRMETAIGAADVIYGGAGDDWIGGGQGNDIIDAGVDNDVVFGGQGADLILGQDGNDVLMGNAGVENPQGDGADYIDGGDGDDGLWGAGGNDYLLGGAGKDTLIGDANGTLPADEGEDVLDGGSGDDILWGGGKDDTLMGRADNDHLFGEAGNDTLDGGAGIDFLAGGAGDDTYLNITGDDTVYDIEGNNTIILATATELGAGGLSASVQTGSDGNQYMQLTVTLNDGSEFKWDNPFFAEGINTIQFAGGDVLDLETLVGEQLATAISLQNDDGGGRLYGGAGDDWLVGGAGADILIGHNGNDILQGGAGDDTYLGVTGGDVIFDIEGNNTIALEAQGLSAGGLTASVQTNADGTQYMELTVALDTGGTLKLDSPFFADGATTLQFAGGATLDLETLVSTSLTTPLTLQLGDNGGRVYGGAGNDLLTGGVGDDTLVGHVGNDTLQGGAGDDVLIGGTGIDTLLGESGNDTLNGGDGDDTLEGGDGDDTLTGNDGNDALDGGLGSNTLLGGAGDDVLRAGQSDAYGGFANTLVGGEGSDTLIGLGWGATDIASHENDPGSVVVDLGRRYAIDGWGGMDRLTDIDGATGSAFDDVLTGDAYDNVLSGGAGNDVLDGAEDDDTLAGGAGVDSYWMRRGSGCDTIVEQAGEQSLLVLEGLALEDLRGEIQGNDLMLRSSKALDSVLIKDYLSNSAAWRVALAGSEAEQQELTTVLAANEAALDAMDLSARLKQDFQDAWYAQESGKLSDWQDLGNGKFQSPVNFGASYSESRDRGTLELYSTMRFVDGFGIVYSTPVDTHTAPLPPNFSENAWVYYGTNFTSAQLGTATFYSDDLVIQSNQVGQVPVGQTTGAWDVSIDWYNQQASQVQSSQASLYAWIQIGPSSFKLGTVSYKLWDYTTIQLNGTALSIAPSESAPVAIDGNSLTQQVWNHQAPQNQFTLSLTKTDVTISNSDIYAGSGDNTIYVNAGDMVSAGAGDDEIVGDYLGDYGDYGGRSELFVGRHSYSEELGIFVNAGAGDDRVLVGSGNDVLIGGAGNDYISGGAGSDLYVLSANSGQDLIVDGGILVSGEASDWWTGISNDTVVFGNGVSLADISLSLGTYVDNQEVLTTLDISWGNESQARIALDPGGLSPLEQWFNWQGTKLPYEYFYIDGVGLSDISGITSGFGIEQFKFADGTVVGMNDLLSQTGPLLSQGYFYANSDGVAAYVQSLSTHQGVLDASSSKGLTVLRGSSGQFHEANARDVIHAGTGDNLILVRNLSGTDIFLQEEGRANLMSSVLHDRIYNDPGYGREIEMSRVGDDLQFNVLNIELGWDQNTYTQYEVGIVENINLFTVKGWFSFAETPSVYLNGRFDLAGLTQQFLEAENGLIPDGASVRVSTLDVTLAEVDWWSSGYLQEMTLGESSSFTSLRGLSGPLEDVFLFEPGMGQVDGVSASGLDLLLFDNAIDSDALTYLKSGDDLVISLGMDSVRLTGVYYDIAHVPYVSMPGRSGVTFDEFKDLGVMLTGTEEADSLTVPDAYGWSLHGLAGDDDLLGNAGNDDLDGGAGSDLLNGGTGADTLNGGAGNDTYVVDDLGDVVTETSTLSTEIDTVQSSIAYTLGANVESLTLTGTAEIDGTGNELANVLRGNSARNVLSGLDGNDTIFAGDGDGAFGGEGNDTLISENTNSWTALSGEGGDDALIGGAGSGGFFGGLGNDTITGGLGMNFIWGDDQAVAGGGNDTITGGNDYDFVIAGVGDDVVYGLGGDDNLSGNQGNDTVYGGAGDDFILGGQGDDFLDGGTGVDTMTGGAGNDTYILGRGYAADTIVENDATAGNTDVAQFLSGISADQIWFQHVGNNLEASIIGTADKLVVKDWYLGNAYHVEQFKTTDGAQTLLDSNVQNLVNAMASFAPPAAGQTSLPTAYQTSLAPVIAANWQ